MFFFIYGQTLQSLTLTKNYPQHILGRGSTLNKETNYAPQTCYNHERPLQTVKITSKQVVVAANRHSTARITQKGLQGRSEQPSSHQGKIVGVAQRRV